MKIGFPQIIFAIVLALAAGCIGSYAANQWRERHAQQSLHDFVHQELDLKPSQTMQLDQLESRFILERKELDLSLRAANARLAAAIQKEQAYGPKVALAIDDVHASMGDLQKATVSHVFAMRALLDAKQQTRFDRQVASSLTRDPGE